MGLPISKEARVDMARSDLFDRQVTEDYKRCKILLLDSGESDKSMLVKRKEIHRRGFEARELADYRAMICKSVVDSARTLARVVRRVGAGTLQESQCALVYAMTMSQPPFSKRALLAKARSDAIDQQILDDSVRFRKECKILLLGAGESGKSAIVKRMKIHHGGFDAGELVEFRTTIHKNALDSADTLARVVRRVGIDALEESERVHAVQLLAAFPVTARAGEALKVGVDPVPLAWVKLTPALADIIWHVAHIPAIECLLAHATDFYLVDSAMYFLASIHRIASPTYVPSEEDIMRMRLTTTAITETRFPMGCLSIRIIDVGGQRSERKKWIHCFESVTSVLFCTALSEYDEVCLEDRRVNRMRESLYLFESVINSRWFLRTSIILFLNHIDVFKQKLPKSPLERYFPEYTGGNDLQKAAKFILWKFMQENRAKLTVCPHVTQANDITNIRLVFAAAKETILQNALKDSGIL